MENSLTYPEAAKFLGLSQSTLRRLVDQGVITPCRHGRLVRFEPDEIQRFLTQQRDSFFIPEKKPGGHQLYRHYDNSGVLLYVGISLSAMNRLIEHRSKSRWYERVAVMTIENFETREQVIEAELTAIQTEFPIFNKDGNERDTPFTRDIHESKYLRDD